MAQGLAFLFGASLSTQGPSLLADPLNRAVTTYFLSLWDMVFLGNKQTLRTLG